MLIVNDGTGINEVYPGMSCAEFLRRFDHMWAKPHAIGVPIKGPTLADVWAFEFRKRGESR